MRVAVFGAGGGIGRRVVERLLADGHEVAALVRTPGKLAMDEVAVADPDLFLGNREIGHFHPRRLLPIWG